MIDRSKLCFDTDSTYTNLFARMASLANKAKRLSCVGELQKRLTAASASDAAPR